MCISSMIIRLIILFVFVFALLMLNIPQLAENDHLSYKLYIFCGVFLFEFIVLTFKLIYHKQVIDIGKIVKESFQSSLLAVIGYSIWTDFQEHVSYVPDQPIANIHNQQIMDDRIQNIDRTQGKDQIQNTAESISLSSGQSIFSNLKITTLIILFISAGYSVDILFKETRSSINDCLNLIYNLDSKTNP